MTRTITLAATAGFALAMILPAVTPPAEAAVSNAVRRACERAANKVTPPLRAGEREAYITNCIANAATTSKKTKKRYY